MRISDWSSDVCSSDLAIEIRHPGESRDRWSQDATDLSLRWDDDQGFVMRAFIFPGQGSQAVGMGKALADASPVAREVFQEVDEALGQHLFKLMSEGRSEEHTSELQSLMRISYAVFCLKKKNIYHNNTAINRT